MEELRSEIRAAFEQEQAAHPPAAALRRNVVEAVTVQPRRTPNLQWLAIAAAAILGILVVAGLMSTRLAHRASVPAATPQARPLKDYGPPPAGVPLLYLIDPHNSAWLQAYDWQGHPRGTVKLALPFDRSQWPPLIAAPDGSGFLYQPQEGAGLEYLDRLGQPIAPNLIPPAPLDISPMWADDNRHVCFVRFESPSGEWRLITKLPGEADHLVGTIASDPNNVLTAISLASCSFRNDQAILVRTTRAWPSELWVVRISDGKVLSDNTYSNPGSVTTVVASRDGVLIAENSSQTTVIRRVSDRSVVASLALVDVRAFSGDDSLVLVANGSGFGPARLREMSVIDVRSGQALPWHYRGTSTVVTVVQDFVAQPGGRDFAISLIETSAQLFPVRRPITNSSPGPQGWLVTTLIIHGDGSITKLPYQFVVAG